MKHFSFNLLVLATIIQTSFTIAAAAAAALSNKEASQQFLEENAKKPGVITTPTGLQYKIIRTGLGQHHPELTSPTECHYKGLLIDGITEFDSSYRRGKPSLFQPRQVIKGWTEVMQMMVEGDKWELYIPSNLAYGEKGSPPTIKPNDALIFTMEMIEIKGTKVDDDHAVRCDVKDKVRCNEKELKYVETAMNKYSSNDGNSVDISKVDAEIERLKRVSEKGSDKVIDWCNRRTRILNQLRGGVKKEESQEDKEESEL